jgi:hypothetical protein
MDTVLYVVLGVVIGSPLSNLVNNGIQYLTYKYLIKEPTHRRIGF